MKHIFNDSPILLFLRISAEKLLKLKLFLFYTEPEEKWCHLKGNLIFLMKSKTIYVTHPFISVLFL